ncbi:MAG: glycerophosphodiester phosphodiesterase family protein [Ancalomicrobiaceae bacterium]|nr:glycerophosphodiester phosphodiesterase family protein [Ancalomicrobiaceae bacterium]
MANTPDWLIARPIAHRGLHDATAGRAENSLSAIGAAADRGFSIEVDVQLSREGEAMVFHDGTLARLCGAALAIDDLTVAELQSHRLGSTADTIPTLWEVLQRIGGRVPIIIEIKNDDPIRPHHHLVQRTVEVVAAYSGPVALKSFDPDVLVAVKQLAPQLPRGIIADKTTDPRYYGHMTARDRFVRRHLLHAYRTQPDFVSYCIKDLPAPGPAVLRTFFNRPTMTWTVRTPQDRLRASTYADQIIFEGFVP